MRRLNFVKKLVAAVSLIGACAGAGATTTVLGPISVGLTPFSGFAAPGLFGDTFTFTAPANGGSVYSVISFPFVLPPELGGGSFNTSLTVASLWSDVDTNPFNNNETMLAQALSVSNTLNLSWGPTSGGNYFLTVQGATSGSLGGVYSGAISISPVPEPETYGLFLAGLGLLGTIIARRRKV